ncbi:hypothetical protein NM688_g3832 [Phlebia brevispora]|uniref:Uncharacterized protein n=1 Tax=Phlebia brevispora TaxID=194682 RepID=A0ACC1T4U8_9APHY|nr:hypothetical protein NM688_g3832 [Phlebia brevispora]
MPVEQKQDRVVLKHPKGATVEILLYGATVISWKAPSPLNPEIKERLFVSSKAVLDGSKPVRGGIPLVFPCFGPPSRPEHSKLAQHGFARSETWKFGGIVMDNEAGVSVKFLLEPIESIKAKYDKPFELTYIVTLAEHQISTDLHVKNTALSTTGPLEFQALFHTYFAAPAKEIGVTPLQGVSYYDTTGTTPELKSQLHTESRAVVTIPKFTDNVYQNAPGKYHVTWPGGGVEVTTKNLKDVVVWNPQEEAGAKIGDMEPGGWNKFLCLEPGHVCGYIQLPAGETWTGHQVITVTDGQSSKAFIPELRLLRISACGPCVSMDRQIPTLRVRINQIDYTLQPSGSLDNTCLPRVPIIRIYGESTIGKKACIHIHQVYPYFFVEYTGKMVPEHVNRYIARLTVSLNHAIAVSLKRNPNSPNSRFVRAIILVKGVLLTDPGIVNRAVTLLQAGTIMKMRFRVYESHLSYLLQFMSDFGLYGCGWIDLAELWQRDSQDPSSEDNSEASQANSLPSGLSVPQSPYYRQTRMPLELDASAHQILNRHRLSPRDIHHQLAIPAPSLPDEPVVLSVRELWEDERKRRAAKGLSPTPVLPRDPSERSRGKGGDWAAELHWWDEIRKRIERERAQEPEPPPSQSWEKWVMTTFESVEALWERQWRVWKPSSHENVKETCATIEDNPYEASTTDVSSSQESNTPGAESEVDVDEAMITSQEISRIVAQEEDEWKKREEARPEVNNDTNITEESLTPEAELEEEDSVTPKPSPTKYCHSAFYPAMVADVLFSTPSKAAQREAYQLALQKLTRLRPTPTSRSRSTTPTQGSRQSSIEARTPRPSDVVGRVSDAATGQPGAMPSGPVLDTSENPFLVHVCANAQDIASHTDRGLFAAELAARATSVEHEVTMSSTYDRLNGLFDVSDRSSRRSVSPTSANGGHFVRRKENDLATEPPAKRRKLDIDDTTSLEPITSPMASSRSRPPPTPFPRAPARASQAVTVYEYAAPPPSTVELLLSMDNYGIPSKLYQHPFYSIESDAPERPREFAGLVFDLKGGTGMGVLDEFVGTAAPEAIASQPKLSNTDVRGWEYASLPPSLQQVNNWLRENKGQITVGQRKKSSQITGPTQLNPYGLKGSDPSVPVSARGHGSMTALSLEVFAPSRDNHLPDPGTDEIAAIFWSYYDSNLQRDDHDEPFKCEDGVIAVQKSCLDPKKLRDQVIDAADTELEVINRLIDIVNELDPDIVTGWEIQAASWGYLTARASLYGLDVGEQISRAPGRQVIAGSDQWGVRTTSTFKVVGRHVLNLWRIMRSEQSLLNYSFENVVFNTLRRRTPRYTPSTLTQWYYSATPEHVSRLLIYYSTRTSMVLEVIEVAEIVTKTSEFARVFGVDFFSVLSRGSQFKVESFMSRIAKPESFLLLSPSKQDVGKQNAAECMPLIMEPLSALYNSPLLVLDFQSLYPSVMIAYNYCYSTCLGRVVDFKGQNKFGVTELHQPPGLLEKLQDHIIVSPNGMLFVKPEVRKGLLGRMLTELLDTRVMVKQAMKSVTNDKALQRVLDARQLSLKFIANVTYGYTSATYSGRMPAVEIADAIVQTGRETLEKAIRLIDATKKWGAKVVYGDTDSVFIYLKGKTKEQAFRIGNDIAETVTAMNPAPIKLKFEKVYLPCVLMAKKRYVGFKYESPDDKEPVFDAKGIETVRRDGVIAQQKMVETSLKILFRTSDLSKVKDYCCTTWAQILENKAPVQDFIFAKEVKMGTYSDKGPPPPGVAVAARRMAEDPNDEPQYGDRIPYVIIRGSPGTRLVDRAVRPEEVLNDAHKYIDAPYYISRVLIPPLERIFNLVGADVRGWYDEMPKALHADEPDSVLMSPRKASKQAALINRYKIDEHFFSSHCIVCNCYASDIICDQCRSQPQDSIATLSGKLNRTETRLKQVQLVCTSCSGIPTAEPILCESLDCPWLYERKKIENRTDSLQLVRDVIDDLEADINEEQIALELGFIEAEDEAEDYEELDEEVWIEEAWEEGVEYAEDDEGNP